MLKQIVAYYLPFDSSLSLQVPWIWANAWRYAYRNAIACVALVGISLTADSYQFHVAAVAAHAMAIVTIFFATIFTAAAIDPRMR